MASEGILFGLGNPLLDISATADADFLKKYDLEANNAILAEDKHKDMYGDMVSQYTVEYVPGGATQNSIKVAQWLLGTPNATTFMGCIGDDKFGKILAEKTRNIGVNVQYQIHEKEPTGTCAVLLTDNNRSLCAYLAAANCFSKDHLAVEANRKLMEKAQYYYMAGFPLTVCPPAMLEVAKHACKENKVLCMNLSAPFLCQFFKDPMNEMLPYVDVLFANETEADTFSKEQNFETSDIEEIALKAAALPKENSKRSRMVIFTQGDKDTIVAKDGKITKYPVIPIEAKDIVDTNGAGDAFVGGFLSQLVLEKSMEDCIRAGNYAANLIIQRSGCTFPEKHNFQ